MPRHGLGNVLWAKNTYENVEQHVHIQNLTQDHFRRQG